MAARAAAVVVRGASTLLADAPSFAAIVAAMVVTLPLLTIGQHVQLPLGGAAAGGATWVRAPGVLSPHPTGDLPLLDDRHI